MFDLSLRVRIQSSLAVMAAVSIAAITGCSDGRPQTYPVQGSVRFDDGRPVPAGVVEFRSQPGGRIAKGKIDQHGQFRLRTFDDGDGAVAGKHQVVLIQHFDPLLWRNKEPSGRVYPLEHQQHEHEHEVHFVQRRYADYKTSDLTAIVKPQANNKIELNIGIPEHPLRSDKSGP